MISIGCPFIGWGKPVPVNPGRFRGSFARHRGRGMALVAFAGPLSNVAQALLMAIPYQIIVRNNIEVSENLWLFIQIFIWVNVLLASFNMIPIPPLDGNKILTGILPGLLAARPGAARAIRLHDPAPDLLHRWPAWRFDRWRHHAARSGPDHGRRADRLVTGFAAIRTRIRQAITHATSSKIPTLPGNLRRLLVDDAWECFTELSAADQRHLIDVATRLADWSDDLDLVAAGLLHDIGKAVPDGTLHLADRVVYVLLPRRLQEWAGRYPKHDHHSRRSCPLSSSQSRRRPCSRRGATRIVWPGSFVTTSGATSMIPTFGP